MKGYTVSWWQFAKGRLTDLWLEAADKVVVSRAANEIDQRLAVDPELCAENCHEELYRLTVDPLTVQYTIDRLNRQVIVWTVRRSDV